MIRFSEPFITGKEIEYIGQAINNKRLSGNGVFTQNCCQYLESAMDCKKVLLTSSCTDALEMAAILSNIEPGDEVIMPSYTFVSTANAFVLRGAVPVFVDINESTLNIDFQAAKSAINEKTKAIVVVHYAGVACDMDEFVALCRDNQLVLIEDAAQAIGSTYKGKALGSIGDLGALSFHETKNIVCGEGGALLVNRNDMVERSEIIWEKGTNRSQFFRGQVDKYTWVDVGSSFLPSELQAAFLFAQFEKQEEILSNRLAIWNKYYNAFLEFNSVISLPKTPRESTHNGHIFYFLFKDTNNQMEFLSYMANNGVNAVFHYIPLHSSPAGLKYGKTSGSLDVTNSLAQSIVRLPIYSGMNSTDVETIIALTKKYLKDL